MNTPMEVEEFFEIEAESIDEAELKLAEMTTSVEVVNTQYTAHYNDYSKTLYTFIVKYIVKIKDAPKRVHPSEF